MANCNHEHKHLCRKIASNGMSQYGYQCDRCGQIVSGELSNGGLWVKRTLIPDLQREKLPEFDENLQTLWYATERERFQEEREEIRAAEKRDWLKDYSEYLKTPQWRKKRAAVLRRANSMCEGCGHRYATEVHHTTYEHVGNEFLFELVALCGECHRRYHDKGD